MNPAAQPKKMNPAAAQLIIDDSTKKTPTATFPIQPFEAANTLATTALLQVTNSQLEAQVNELNEQLKTLQKGYDTIMSSLAEVTQHSLRSFTDAAVNKKELENKLKNQTELHENKQAEITTLEQKIATQAEEHTADLFTVNQLHQSLKPQISNLNAELQATKEELQATKEELQTQLAQVTNLRSSLLTTQGALTASADIAATLKHQLKVYNEISDILETHTATGTDIKSLLESLTRLKDWVETMTDTHFINKARSILVNNFCQPLAQEIIEKHNKTTIGATIIHQARLTDLLKYAATGKTVDKKITPPMIKIHTPGTKTKQAVESVFAEIFGKDNTIAKTVLKEAGNKEHTNAALLCLVQRLILDHVNDSKPSASQSSAYSARESIFEPYQQADTDTDTDTSKQTTNGKQSTTQETTTPENLKKNPPDTARSQNQEGDTAKAKEGKKWGCAIC